MSSKVQTRRTPPVLRALERPETLPTRRIIARIKLIHEYAERYRELDLSEATELLTLKYLLENGTLPPVRAAGKTPRYNASIEELLA